MFLIFWKSEPQRSYKHGSYKKKGVAKKDRTVSGLDIAVCGL